MIPKEKNRRVNSTHLCEPQIHICYALYHTKSRIVFQTCIELMSQRVSASMEEGGLVCSHFCLFAFYIHYLHTILWCYVSVTVFIYMSTKLQWLLHFVWCAPIAHITITDIHTALPHSTARLVTGPFSTDRLLPHVVIVKTPSITCSIERTITPVAISRILTLFPQVQNRWVPSLLIWKKKRREKKERMCQSKIPRSSDQHKYHNWMSQQRETDSLPGLFHLCRKLRSVSPPHNWK